MGRKIRDKSGHRFGKLTPIAYVRKKEYSGIFWICLCDCGGSNVVATKHLTEKSGIKSCGCGGQEVFKQLKFGYKTCKCCNNEKPMSSFSKDKSRKDGHHPYCKPCKKTKDDDYRDRNPEKIKQQLHNNYQNNKERRKADSKQYRSENKEYLQKYHKQYREKNGDYIRARDREYWAQNKEILNESQKLHYQANKKEIALKAKESYLKSPEKAKGRAKGWYHENKEKALETHREWRENNPERSYELDRRKRARKRNAEGEYTKAEFIEIIKQYNNMCLACKRNDIPLTADHVIPLSVGGSNWISNIQPLCLPCNASKGTQIIDYR